MHTATIYNELKRGYVGELDSRQREIYKAERAQAIVQEHFKRRREGWEAACIVNYDRGWDVRPKDKEAEDVLKILLAYLEALPQFGTGAKT